MSKIMYADGKENNCKSVEDDPAFLYQYFGWPQQLLQVYHSY